MYTSVNDRFNIPPIVTVASGKGGVGKTLVSLGLAGILSARGIKVLLIDADLGLGNLHILTNTIPIFTIEDLLTENCRLEDACLRISDNLDLLPAASGIDNDGIDLDINKNSLRLRLAGLKNKYDLIVVDTPSGISAKTTSFIGLADELILVVTPELGALADGYAVLKLTNHEIYDRKTVLFVNMSQSAMEGLNTAEKFSDMTDKFLGLQMKQSVWLPHDPQIKAILLRQNLLSQKGGNCLFLQALHSAAQDVFSDFPTERHSDHSPDGDKVKSHFELSSQTSPSDKRIEILHAGELEDKTENPKSHVSRNDSL
jgi:flagellar biosynthesis protein FlhG